MVLWAYLGQIVILLSCFAFLGQLVWLKRRRLDQSHSIFYKILTTLLLINCLLNLASLLLANSPLVAIEIRFFAFACASIVAVLWLAQIFKTLHESPASAKTLSQQYKLLQQQIARRQKVEKELRHCKHLLDLGLVEKTTTQERSNRKLQASGEVFEALVNSSPLPIIILDWHQRVVLWNPAAEKIFGWTCKEVLGKSLPTIPRRKLKEFTSLLKLTQSGTPQCPLDTKRKKKDGTLIDVRVWNAPLHLPRDDHGTAMAIFESITEKAQTEKALRQAKIAAEKAKTAKTTFIANVTHEFRTPIVAIMNFTELLLNEELSRSEQIKFLTIIKNNSAVLHALISDILDLSTLETGHMNFTLAATDFLRLLDDVVNTFASQAHRKGLEFTFTVAPDFPEWVETDALRVKQILYNLLGNAVKFTSQGRVGTQVNYCCKHANLIHCTIRICDSGDGISDDEADALFKPFVQLKKTSQAQACGTGLGLYLAKKMAQGLGGDVTFVKSSEHKGSTFEIILPMKPLSTNGLDSARASHQEVG